MLRMPQKLLETFAKISRSKLQAQPHGIRSYFSKRKKETDPKINLEKGCLQRSLLILLILSLILSSICNKAQAARFKYAFSLAKAPDGTPLHHPFSIFIDPKVKRIYVTDVANNRLVSYDFAGKPLKAFNAAGKLKGPIFMIKDENILWVVERPLNSLTLINLKDRIFKRNNLTWGRRPILVDRIATWGKNVVVLDRASGRVFLLNQYLEIQKIFPSKKLKTFNGIYDIKIKGNWLWGLENMSSKLYAFNLNDGSFHSLTLKKQMVVPVSFDIDSAGNIYVLDRDLKKVFVFDKKGNFKYSFLQEGFRPGQDLYPSNLVIYENYLFLVDEGNGRVDVWQR
ncbi:6-bladed beta-propeller [Thermodesulfatator atlanticus]